MKILILLTTFVVIINTSQAQSKFIGNWYDTPSANDEFSDDILDVGKDSTSFEVARNQLGLTCKNKYKLDTLLLYVAFRDCGRLFYSLHQPPKLNSLFAKCYLHDGELHIIYTQKIFKENIREFGLKTVLYKHD